MAAGGGFRGGVDGEASKVDPRNRLIVSPAARLPRLQHGYVDPEPAIGIRFALDDRPRRDAGAVAPHALGADPRVHRGKGRRLTHSTRDGRRLTADLAQLVVAPHPASRLGEVRPACDVLPRVVPAIRAAAEAQSTVDLAVVVAVGSAAKNPGALRAGHRTTSRGPLAGWSCSSGPSAVPFLGGG